MTIQKNRIADWEFLVIGAFNDLLDTAEETSGTMDEQCSWLYTNISSDVADYCNDTTSAFRHGGFSSEPFSSSDFV